jgi:putative secretion ATPase (PEP-CTERM system associated)
MYDGFYNLTQKPFQLSPDPEFFFNSTIHKRALAYMEYGLTQGEGFVLVTGSPGTGKTMLVKSLIRNLNKEKLMIGVMMTTHIGPDDVMRMVASTFGIQNFYNDKAGLLSSFEKFIFEQYRNGRTLLLIVDEAQNLPKQSLEELRMLTNLDVDGKSVFQVFLIGQSELKRTIHAADMEQLKQRIVSTFHLEPLGVEETRNYILFRLQTAGWKGKPEFTSGSFEMIHEFTAGIPRRINTLCDRLLLFGFLEELSVLDEQALQKVISEVDEEMHLDENNELTANGMVDCATNFFESYENSHFEKRFARLEQAVLELQEMAKREKTLLRNLVRLQSEVEAVYRKFKHGDLL